MVIKLAYKSGQFAAYDDRLKAAETEVLEAFNTLWLAFKGYHGADYDFDEWVEENYGMNYSDLGSKVNEYFGSVGKIRETLSSLFDTKVPSAMEEVYEKYLKDTGQTNSTKARRPKLLPEQKHFLEEHPRLNGEVQEGGDWQPYSLYADGEYQKTFYLERGVDNLTEYAGQHIVVLDAHGQIIYNNK